VVFIAAFFSDQLVGMEFLTYKMRLVICYTRRQEPWLTRLNVELPDENFPSVFSLFLPVKTSTGLHLVYL
jgi:hypothetical protein